MSSKEASPDRDWQPRFSENRLQQLRDLVQSPGWKALVKELEARQEMLQRELLKLALIAEPPHFLKELGGRLSELKVVISLPEQILELSKQEPPPTQEEAPGLHPDRE